MVRDVKLCRSARVHGCHGRQSSQSKSWRCVQGSQQALSKHSSLDAEQGKKWFEVETLHTYSCETSSESRESKPQKLNASTDIE